MSKKSLAILSAVILIGALELTTLPQAPMEVLALINVFVIALYLLVTSKKIALPIDIGVGIILIWTIYLGHLMMSTISGSVLFYSVIRIPLFLFFLVVFLFIIPQATSAEMFLHILSRFGAVVTLMGLFVLAIGGFTIGPLQLEPYGWKIAVVPLIDGPRVHAMTSLFTNPNMVSFICSIGLVAGMTELDRTKSRTAVLFTILNGVGLRLSGSRAAQLGVLVAFAVYVSYRIIGPKLAVTTFGGAIISIIALIGVQFEVIPPLPLLGDISLNNREIIWRGALRAVSTSPWFGLGLVPSGPAIQPYTNLEKGTHSAFVYQFLTSGLVGLGAYVYIYVRTIIGGLATATSRRSMAVYAVAITLLISQAFQTYSLLGVTMLPAVTALSLGFAIDEFIKNSGASTVEIHKLEQSSQLSDSLVG